MYTEYFGLSTKPFNMTPDPAFLYLTRQHREALAGLTYAILDRKGFLVLSGTAGSGKTTLLHWVLEKLPKSRLQTSVIFNPTVTREEFLEMAMLDFGITDVPASKAQRLRELEKLLLRGKAEGKVNVLIVDEAHKLSPELLEEVRLLGNFESAEEKMLQILLVGQSELDEVLGRPELFQLKQRVNVRLSLEPLSAGEVEHYIAHRWRVAGGKKAAPFTTAATARVAELSKGIPRLVNLLCDSALVQAFGANSAAVNPEHVEASATDLLLWNGTAKPGVIPFKPPVAAGSAAVAGGAAVAQTPMVQSLGGNTPEARKQSFFGRWAGKLGLAS